MDIVVPSYRFEIVGEDDSRVPLPKTEEEQGRLLHRIIFGDAAVEPNGKFKCAFVKVPVIGHLVGGGRVGRVTYVLAAVPGCYFIIPGPGAPPGPFLRYIQPPPD